MSSPTTSYQAFLYLFKKVMAKLLKKGLEIELYGGTEHGEVLPLSKKLQEHFSFVTCEPDQRNFEYVTKPSEEYTHLLKEIIEPRLKIRNYLKKLDNLTLIPGSSIPLIFDKDFYYSKPGDPYHEYILSTYKSNIITTSLHINIGIENYETLFKLLCALRFDTPLFLALSASSCFHNGKVTDFHSYRWHSFPKTPDLVPFFTNHDEYINWINEQLFLKKMLNVRHLWTSIRPNGPDRPYDLNRIEIRICDLVADSKKILAIVALIECIIQKYLYENKWPKIINQKQSELNKLINILYEQEEHVAQNSLHAKIWDWRNDTKTEVYKLIESLHNELESIAKKLEVLKYMSGVLDILKDGNEAIQFLELYKRNKSIPKTIQHFIKQFNIMDLEYSKQLEIYLNK